MEQGLIGLDILAAAHQLRRWDYPARLACIDDFVQALPMGYNSLVGDMGSVMSAGQAQRVLLARVFYKQPKLIFLDEATANLDGETERRVLENLSGCGATIVIVSHRSAPIAIANRVYRCQAGGLLCESENVL